MAEIGSKNTKKVNVNNYLLIVFLFLGLIWVRSSLGKLTSGNFAQSLTEILEKFASKNPYPWYKNFLQTTAIPNGELLGKLVLWGEFFAALAILTGSVYLLLKPASKLVLILLAFGFLGAGLLNTSFWLASGWTSPSSDNLNLFMLVIEIVGLFYVYKLYRTKK